VAELNSTRCNFIRCIKPNYQMEVAVFETLTPSLALTLTLSLTLTLTLALII